MLVETSPGQVSVHAVAVPVTVASTLKVLFDVCGSPVVLLEIFAELVMNVPLAVPAVTLKVKEKIATASTGSVAIVQGPFPEGGVVKLGPEFCTKDTKVVLAGVESVSVTDSASSGPWLINSIR